MATKVEVVVQQALRCFTRQNRALPETFQADLAVLKEMVNGVTSRDIKFLRCMLQRAELDSYLEENLDMEPVDYVRIFENHDVSIGVFILLQGAKLPIHDHPNMYGILKVLQGTIKLTNYSMIGPDTTIPAEKPSFYYKHALKAIKHPDRLITPRNGCSTLTPNEMSIHEVVCLNGPAAFLDILSPPYKEENVSTPRGCHYFKELEAPGEDGHVRLLQIQDPNYWAIPEN